MKLGIEIRGNTFMSHVCLRGKKGASKNYNVNIYQENTQMRIQLFTIQITTSMSQYGRPVG